LPARQKAGAEIRAQDLARRAEHRQEWPRTSWIAARSIPFAYSWLALIARFRNRVEASFKEITDQMELARHGAHCFEGLLTRTAATLAAHALLLAVLADKG
jgi:hypothetical protein